MEEKLNDFTTQIRKHITTLISTNLKICFDLVGKNTTKIMNESCLRDIVTKYGEHPTTTFLGAVSTFKLNQIKLQLVGGTYLIVPAFKEK